MSRDNRVANERTGRKDAGQTGAQVDVGLVRWGLKHTGIMQIGAQTDCTGRLEAQTIRAQRLR